MTTPPNAPADTHAKSSPIYLIQACVAGRWTTVGNRLCKAAADKLADMWAAETSHEYRVTEVVR